MPTIVTTVGAANANSYVSVADADTYMASRLHAEAWVDDAGATEKEAALIWAARLIDTTVRFNGTKVTSTQSMAWPRAGLTDESGYDVPENGIPQIIKYLQMELALLLLTTDRTKESQASAAGLTSLRAGPVSLSFKDEIQVKQIPDTLMAMLPMEWVWQPIPNILVVS